MTDAFFRSSQVSGRAPGRFAVGVAVGIALLLAGCGSTQQGLGSLLPQAGAVSTPPATASTATASTSPPQAGGSGPAAAIVTGSTGPVDPQAEGLHGAGNVHVVVAGSRLGVYERVARNALTCWLGGEGPLKGSHVFGAEVPPDRGDGRPKGETEIGIYQRDPAQAAARGLRAYRILFEMHGDSQVTVDAANSKIAPDLATAMGRDVETWARGGDGCAARIARPYVPPVAAPEAKSKTKAGARTKKPAPQRKAG